MSIANTCLLIREYEPVYGDGSGIGGRKHGLWMDALASIFGDRNELYGIVSESRRYSQDKYIITDDERAHLRSIGIRKVPSMYVAFDISPWYYVDHQVLFEIRQATSGVTYD